MKLTQAKEVIVRAFNTNRDLYAEGAKASELLNVYLVGDPGLGKTAIVRQAAEDLGVECREVIVGQYDPGELAGLVYLKEDSYVRARPNWLPEEGEGILFLDELPQAVVMSQNLMAQLTNERCIGEHKLGDGWQIVAAGNKTANRAGTSVMPTHLRDRLLFVEVEVNMDDVVEFFNGQGTDERITGMMRYRPDFIAKFDAGADACPSPRSWMRVNTILGMGLEGFTEFETIKGTIGEAAATDFKGYCDLYHKMPDPDGIIDNPEDGEIPEDPALLFALTSALSARANKENVGAILTYVNRLINKEFAVFCVKDMGSRFPELRKEKSLRDWIMKEGKELLF
jgi:hypothetical protein